MPDDPRIAAALDAADAALLTARDVARVMGEESDANSKRLADAVTEANRWKDITAARDLTIAAITKQLNDLKAGGSGIPLWTPAAVISAGSSWIVPDGTSDNIIVPPGAVGVTLYLGSGLYPKIPQRPFLGLYADLFKVIATPGRLTFDAPAGASAGASGRYGFAEMVRLGIDAAPYTQPIRGGILVDVSGGRIDALGKCYPDCDGVTWLRPHTTGDTLADGIFSGGSKGLRIIDPDLTCRNENTVRATSQNGVITRDMTVLGGRVTNAGGKAALNPRNVDGFVAVGVTLSARQNNAACGIGGGTPAPGDAGPSNVTIERCPILSGSIMLYAEARAVRVLANPFRWQDKPDNQAISINENAQDVTVIDNSGESPVQQKAMVGYAGGSKSNVRNLTEYGNAWVVKP